MKVIILSAGQGRRLLPLTAGMPKCGVHISGRSILEWQLKELSKCAIDEVVIVTGFRAKYIDEMIEGIDSLPIRTIHNPFFDASDNLGTCWVARSEMIGDFAILNGDTLFENAVMEKLLSTPTETPITLAVDTKEEYDEDDMKVIMSGDRLVRVGKKLALDRVNGESIGMMVFRNNGPDLFVDMVEQLMLTEKGLKLWYLSAIDYLADTGHVGVVNISGLSWCEIDDMEDLEKATKNLSAWAR